MIRESAAAESTELTWFKSSYSDSSNGNDCIEVAATPRTIHIRDSKTPDSEHLDVTPATWATFVSYAAGH